MCATPVTVVMTTMRMSMRAPERPWACVSIYRESWGKVGEMISLTSQTEPLISSLLLPSPCTTYHSRWRPNTTHSATSNDHSHAKEALLAPLAPLAAESESGVEEVPDVAVAVFEGEAPEESAAAGDAVAAEVDGGAAGVLAAVGEAAGVLAAVGEAAGVLVSVAPGDGVADAEMKASALVSFASTLRNTRAKLPPAIFSTVSAVTGKQSKKRGWGKEAKDSPSQTERKKTGTQRHSPSE
jgi:hypothetical protein